MSQYLVVAEVDKIQSFIFRSSRLREVVGASYLLEQFGESIEQQYKTKYGEKNVLSSKGGSFRIIVNEKEVPVVKEDLRRRFDQEIGGSITITSVPLTSESTVIKEGNKALRHTKLEGTAPQPMWHSPYHAICASSGEELATEFAHPSGYDNGIPRHPEERQRYIGKLTLQKSDESGAINLLNYFASRMGEIAENLNVIPFEKKATEADTYARFDPRQYVAYMVSDGNGMGAVFNQCKTSELPGFSKAVDTITKDALIYAVEKMGAETHLNGNVQFPVLPLISGGDDLFVLMPAPWAIDVTRKFCELYQNGLTDKDTVHQMDGMTSYIRKNIEAFHNDDKFIATTGVAVVICKATYPYRTAYQYAHELLSKAKQRAREEKQSCLIVDFVVGSDTVVADSRVEPKPHTFEDAEYFIQQRVNLKGIASRTRHQVSEALSNEKDADQRIVQIIKQVKRQYPDFEYADNLQRAYDESPTRLHELLKLWDFCYDMNRQRDKYLTEER